MENKITLISEDSCKRCAICCSYYINGIDGSIYLPSFKCKQLVKKDGKWACENYYQRKCPPIIEVANSLGVHKDCAYFSGKEKAVATPLEEFILIKQMPEEQFRALIKYFNVI